MIASHARALLADPEFRKLSVLIGTGFIDMVGFAIVFPLMPFYALELRASPAMIGWIMAAYSLAQLAAAPIWGRVSDRRGRRPVLLIGLLASAVAYVVFGFATSVGVLLVSRIIQGLGGGTTGVVHAYVGDAISPARRTQALGWLSAASALGVAFGPVIGSAAVQIHHAGPGLVAAALCLINTVFTWRWLPESKGPQATPADGHRRRAPIWLPVWSVVSAPRRPVSRLTWIYGAGMLGFSAMTSVLALFLGARFGINEKTIGYFFLYTGILSFLMRTIVLGPAIRRFGETGAVRLGTVALVLGLVAYPLVPSIWILPIAMTFVPVGTALLFPATTALLSKASDPAALGGTMGAAQTFAGAARVIAPILATRAFQEFGPGSPFYLAALIVAGVGVLAFQLHNQSIPRPVPESP
ncbi:MAG: MFS transporter [Gemmatimonadetes bacterium]|nr:MFS transporter [Gemmatimonadota bacterium]